MFLFRIPASKFPLGIVFVTTNVLNIITLGEIADALRRHSQGDWGDLCPKGVDQNNDAVIHGKMIHSVYGDGDFLFWIITEADRSVTSIRLPDDY